jgi:hypothetical protein
VLLKPHGEKGEEERWKGGKNKTKILGKDRNVEARK